MLYTILIVIVVFCLLGYGGGIIRPGLYSPFAGNSMGGLGVILFIVVIILLLRG